MNNDSLVIDKEEICGAYEDKLVLLETISQVPSRKSSTGFACNRDCRLPIDYGRSDHRWRLYFQNNTAYVAVALHTVRTVCWKQSIGTPETSIIFILIEGFSN
jgi:hypothetical protein